MCFKEDRKGKSATNVWVKEREKAAAKQKKAMLQRERVNGIEWSIRRTGGGKKGRERENVYCVCVCVTRISSREFNDRDNDAKGRKKKKKRGNMCE